jgi:hypothetical protein
LEVPIPTRVRALRADWSGAFSLSDPLVRSSRRIAKQILRYAPSRTPAAAPMIEMVMRAAMTASELCCAALHRDVYRRSRFPETSAELTAQAR